MVFFFSLTWEKIIPPKPCCISNYQKNHAPPKPWLYFFINQKKISQWNNHATVDGSEILHQLRLVVYPIIYQGFLHPRWCRISSINSTIPVSEAMPETHPPSSKRGSVMPRDVMEIPLPTVNVDPLPRRRCHPWFPRWFHARWQRYGKSFWRWCKIQTGYLRRHGLFCLGGFLAYTPWN